MDTNICQVSIATKSDIDTLAQFQINMAMESEGYALNPTSIHAGITAAMDDANKGLYLVARTADSIVGSLMLTREWSDWNNCWYWWIQSVYVLPQYRGKGIYRVMYARVKEMAQESNVTQVRLYVDKGNVTAQKVYQQLGMSDCHYYMYEEVVK